MNIEQICKDHTYEILEQLDSDGGHDKWLDLNGEFGIAVAWDSIEDLEKGQFTVKLWDGSRAYAGPNERTMRGFSLDNYSSNIETELALEIGEVREDALIDA
ncbi:hypothetical protein [Tateyamaria pelophila]|uniref:hypothetical protein n=1 Tax=Tateyamaria pelophila TaxID=328415 RepID=UPI001CBC2B22|nr:hypothetical protein [Tateyamaria pelophila]